MGKYGPEHRSAPLSPSSQGEASRETKMGEWPQSASPFLTGEHNRDHDPDTPALFSLRVHRSVLNHSNNICNNSGDSGGHTAAGVCWVLTVCQML